MGGGFTGDCAVCGVENPSSPTQVWDYKFGRAGLTEARILQIRAGAGITDDVPVIEVRP